MGKVVGFPKLCSLLLLLDCAIFCKQLYFRPHLFPHIFKGFPYLYNWIKIINEKGKGKSEMRSKVHKVLEQCRTPYITLGSSLRFSCWGSKEIGQNPDSKRNKQVPKRHGSNWMPYKCSSACFLAKLDFLGSCPCNGWIFFQMRGCRVKVWFITRKSRYKQKSLKTINRCSLRVAFQ